MNEEYEHFQFCLSDYYNLAKEYETEHAERVDFLTRNEPYPECREEVDAFMQWTHDFEDKIDIQFNLEYQELNSKEDYFLGCIHKTYLSTYPKRLADFLDKFPDAVEFEFIECELKKCLVNSPYRFLSTITENKICYSLKRRYEFLEQRLDELGFKVATSSNNPDEYIIKENNRENTHHSQQVMVKWKGSKTELIELVKALIVNKSIVGVQKDIIKKFELFFNIKLGNHYKTISTFKGRNNGSETLFIKRLNDSLLDYIQNENTGKLPSK